MAFAWVGFGFISLRFFFTDITHNCVCRACGRHAGHVADAPGLTGAIARAKNVCVRVSPGFWVSVVLLLSSLLLRRCDWPSRWDRRCLCGFVDSLAASIIEATVIAHDVPFGTQPHAASPLRRHVDALGPYFRVSVSLSTPDRLFVRWDPLVGFGSATGVLVLCLRAWGLLRAL